MSKEAKAVKAPSVAIGYLVIVVMLLVLGVGVAKFGLNIKVALYICAAFNLVIAMAVCHHPWKDVEDAIVQKITNMGMCFLILAGIGFLVGTFMLSGTLPLLVSWLAKLISPKFIIVLSFVLCGVLSLCIGSSFAAMGTLGVVMFSVASVQGLPIGPSAAAVISGCWLGQYISPVADVVNCSSAANKMEVTDYMKQMMPHVGITSIITLIFFFVIGLKNGNVDPASLANVESFIADVNANFNTNFLLILPLVLAIVLSIMKVNTVVVLFSSGFLAIIMGCIFQHFDFVASIEASFSGFSTETFFPEVQMGEALSGLLNRGGIFSMADCYCFLFAALTAVGIMDCIGVFDVIKDTLFKNTTSPVKLTLISTLAMGIFGLTTADPYPPAIVGADLLQGPYEKAGFSKKNACVVSMTMGLLTTMVLPWSFCAWYSGNIYGATIGQVLPYYVLFWGMPIVTIILSFFGKGIAKDEKAESAA